jgi:hypothetical protein
MSGLARWEARPRRQRQPYKRPRASNESVKKRPALGAVRGGGSLGPERWEVLRPRLPLWSARAGVNVGRPISVRALHVLDSVGRLVAALDRRRAGMLATAEAATSLPQP